MSKIYISLLFCMALLLNVEIAKSQTVVTSNADAGPGTLRQALIDAKDGVADITFNGSMVIELDSVMDLDTLRIESVSIDGGDNGITIDGKGTTRLIRSFIHTGRLNIKNVTFQNAGTLRGAAMHLQGINRFENCTFKDNTSNNFGGAIYLQDTSEFVNCKFIGNESNVRGGAVSVENGKVTFISCLFDGNTVNTKGGPAFGAAFNSLKPSSSAEVINCTFVNNTVGGTSGNARQGGSIHYGNWSPEGSATDPLIVVNSIFWSNVMPSAGFGSAIMLDNDATLKVYNSLLHEANISMDTLIYNDVDFPAIDFFGNAEADSILSIVDCLDGTWTGPYGNGTDDYSFTPFTNLISGNYTLINKLGSEVNPALNTGISSEYDNILPEMDIIGNDRISGTEIDLGAYESENVPPVLVRPISNFTVPVNANDTVLDVSTVYSDPDDDDMTFALVSNSDPDVVTTAIDGHLITISYLAVGTSDIEYSVTSGGVTVINDFTVTVTNISSINNRTKQPYAIHAYPNPFSDKITISFNQLKKTSVSITDLTGRTVMAREIESGDMLNTSGLDDGIYLLNLLVNGRIYGTKVVVKN